LTPQARSIVSIAPGLGPEPAPARQPPSVEPAVRVRGLIKQYKDGTMANRGIDLDVPRGGVVAILGPNGAGKTTFLRQLTTELRPSAGTIWILGVDAVREPRRAKELMGITPQEAGLFESLTVREHLELFGRLKGLRKRDAQSATASLLEQLGLVHEAGRRVGRLSGGQRRRILIGLALLGRPPLLVLDEPTTGLDPASRRDVWSVLRRAVHDGASLILSTHYMEEAERLSDRIGIISGGRLIAFGSLPELLAKVRDSYRLTYHGTSCSAGPLEVRRFATFAEAQVYVERRRLSEYSVARASLEDVYFELAGEPFPADEPSGATR
jgi:ABC-type multidrug transport system ATPase subunit